MGKFTHLVARSTVAVQSVPRPHLVNATKAKASSFVQSVREERDNIRETKASKPVKVKAPF